MSDNALLFQKFVEAKMVYLYQLQQQYCQPVVFASLLLAAVPTLLVFVFCQNIIMRGIVVPVEK